MPNPIGREISPGHRLVSSAMLPDPIVSCPHCGSKNVTLTGEFSREFSIVLEDSKPKENGLTLDNDSEETICGVVCPACNIHTIIAPAEDFERDSLVFDLHTQIAALQGRVPVDSSGKEWKN